MKTNPATVKLSAAGRSKTFPTIAAANLWLAAAGLTVALQCRVTAEDTRAHFCTVKPGAQIDEAHVMRELGCVQDGPVAAYLRNLA